MPASKKRRMAAAAEAAAAMDVDPPPPTATEDVDAAAVQSLLTQSETATHSLLTVLDEMEAAATSGGGGGDAGTSSGTGSSSSKLHALLAQSSNHMLTLKATQRALCLDVESHLVNTVVEQQRQTVGTKTLELQNLVYERDYLAKKVRECREYSCSQLAKMAREELGVAEEEDDAKEGAGSHHQEEEAAAEKVINSFLSRDIHTTSTKAAKNDQEYDYRSTANHPTTLSTLKTELTLRRTVETDLTKARAELAQLKKTSASRKSFLSALPRKLREVERSTGPLQSFFREATASGGGTGGAGGAGGAGETKKGTEKLDVKPTLLIGTDRTTRIEAASTLPAPLYTLYVQLQGYMDAFGDGGIANLEIGSEPPRSGKDAAMSMRSADAQTAAQDWIVRHEKVLILSMDVSAVSSSSATNGNNNNGASASSSSSSSLSSSSSATSATIKFRYLPHVGVVTATASGCGRGEDGGRLLLSGLFPDDDGTALPSCAAPFLIGEYASSTDNSNSSNPATAMAGALAEVEGALVKRGDLPYRWCQYVAGLIYPPTSPPSDGSETSSKPKRGTIEASTRSVVRSLCRRIRARAILATMLQTLSRGRPPAVHSDLKTSGQQRTTRLTSWSETTGNDELCKYYTASIKHTNGSSLKGTVKIDPSYPAVPPLWSLQPATADLNENTMGSRWGEREGTAISLHESSTASPSDPSPPLYDSVMGAIEDALNADLDTLIVDGVEDTYHGILAAQIDRLLECYDSVQDGKLSPAAVGLGRVVSYDLYSSGL